MAARPIGGDSAIVTLPGTMPPMPAVARILARHDRAKLAAFIAVAIDLCDAMDGDSEAEAVTWPEAIEARLQGPCLPDDSEAAGDEADTSWPEWHQRGRRKSDACELRDTNQHEDDEDDDPDTGVEDDPLGIDPEEDRCAAGDDLIRSGSLNCGEVLCEDLGPGDADDAEREQMLDDVPMLPVYSAEHNIFNDKRTRLGRSNLMSSFRANSGGERSADTGKAYVSRDVGSDRKPGHPV